MSNLPQSAMVLVQSVTTNMESFSGTVTSLHEFIQKIFVDETFSIRGCKNDSHHRTRLLYVPLPIWEASAVSLKADRGVRKRYNSVAKVDG